MTTPDKSNSNVLTVSVMNPYKVGVDVLSSQGFGDTMHAILPGVLSVTGGSLAQHYSDFSNPSSIFQTKELKHNFLLGELLGTVLGFITYTFVIARVFNVTSDMVTDAHVRNMLNDFVRWATVLSFIQLFTADPELQEPVGYGEPPFMKLVDSKFLRHTGGWFAGLAFYHLVVSRVAVLPDLAGKMANVRDSVVKFGTVFVVQEALRTYNFELPGFEDRFGTTWMLHTAGFISGLAVYDLFFSDTSLRLSGPAPVVQESHTTSPATATASTAASVTATPAPATAEHFSQAFV